MEMELAKITKYIIPIVYDKDLSLLKTEIN